MNWKTMSSGVQHVLSDLGVKKFHKPELQIQSSACVVIIGRQEKKGSETYYQSSHAKSKDSRFVGRPCACTAS